MIVPGDAGEVAAETEALSSSVNFKSFAPTRSAPAGSFTPFAVPFLMVTVPFALSPTVLFPLAGAESSPETVFVKTATGRTLLSCPQYQFLL